MKPTKIRVQGGSFFSALNAKKQGDNRVGVLSAEKGEYIEEQITEINHKKDNGVNSQFANQHSEIP